MTGIKFDKEQIKAIYDEVDRRILLLIEDDYYTEREINNERRAMLQGVYSVLSSLASNWPEVRYWIDEIEEGGM